MSFKVGDRVTWNAVHPVLSGAVICVKGHVAEVHLDTSGPIYAHINELELESPPPTPAPKFKVGDFVTTKPIPGSFPVSGTVALINLTTTNGYQYEFGTPSGAVFYAYEDELDPHKSITSTSIPQANPTIANNVVQQAIHPPVSQTLPHQHTYRFWKDTYTEAYQSLPADGSCMHEFTEYVGLTERYHFCKKCDKKQ